MSHGQNSFLQGGHIVKVTWGVFRALVEGVARSVVKELLGSVTRNWDHG